ncbi:MAG: DKNYY domain-containing protein [Planctomycetota bacterium]
MDEPVGHGYHRRGEYITFKGQRIDLAGREDIKRFARHVGQDLTICHDVDADTFTALSEPYTKDQSSVYYKWISPGRFWVVTLPEADVGSFEVIGFNLARDANAVWWYGSVLPGLDPSSVKVIKDGFVWKDTRHVWYQHQVIVGAKPDSFEHLEQAFYRDAERVYWSSTPLPEADPKTFRTFGDDSAYGADSSGVWWSCRRVEGVDSVSFRPIHQFVFVDASGVYEAPGRLLDGADPQTFEKVADLDTFHTALLRDADAHYVYLPFSGEVYRVEPGNASLRVSRTIWAGEDAPRRLAQVRAELTEGAWSDPVVRLTGERGSRGLKSQEAHRLEIYREQFEKAWELVRQGR